MNPDDVRLGQVLFEFRQVGSYVRVSAIDVRTNTEISMVGDPAAGQEGLKRAAVRKLKYVIAKNTPDTKGGGPIIA